MITLPKPGSKILLCVGDEILYYGYTVRPFDWYNEKVCAIVCNLKMIFHKKVHIQSIVLYVASLRSYDIITDPERIDKLFKFPL